LDHLACAIDPLALLAIDQTFVMHPVASHACGDALRDRVACANDGQVPMDHPHQRSGSKIFSEQLWVRKLDIRRPAMHLVRSIDNRQSRTRALAFRPSLIADDNDRLVSPGLAPTRQSSTCCCSSKGRARSNFHSRGFNFRVASALGRSRPQNYPLPIVDLDRARKAALDGYGKVRSARN
jgi:hypothetical protein